MKNKKTKLLNLILHISAKINKLKTSIMEGGFFRTLGVALKIIILEIVLLFVSLPVYIFIAPEKISKDNKEVEKYRLKRVVSLVTVCAFIVVFLVTTIFSGGIFLAGPVSELRADSIGWSFDSPDDYIYDQGKIKIIDGMALFNPSADEQLDVKGISAGSSGTFYEPQGLVLSIASPYEDIEENGNDMPEDIKEEPKQENEEELPDEETGEDLSGDKEKSGENEEELNNESAEDLENKKELPDEETGEDLSGDKEKSGENEEELNNESAEDLENKKELPDGETGKIYTATIQPVNSLIIPDVSEWTGFVEVCGKNGGEIYYQLSDDNGSTWYYWEGNSWVKAGPENYNTAKTVNENIGKFPVKNKMLMFNAFFVGSSQNKIQLLDISIEFSLKEDKQKQTEKTLAEEIKLNENTAGIGFEVGGIDSNTGENKSASGNLIRTPGFIEVKSGATCVLGKYNDRAEWPRIYFYDKDKKFISVEGSDTAKAPDNAVFARIRLTLKEAGKFPENVVFSGGVMIETDSPPQYKNVVITGTAKVGETLIAAGTGYNDEDGDKEGTALYQWKISDSLGTTYSDIPKATGNTYTPVAEDIGKFIKAEVTPAALTGKSPGMPVLSDATLAVVSGKEDKITDDEIVPVTLDQLKESGAVSPDFSKWKDIADTGALQTWGGESRLFIENPELEYNLKIKAKLDEGKNGGYGIFFDTTANSENASDDTGYIVQFDRGFGDGAIVIRPRTGGYEFNPVKVLKAGENDIIPTKSANPGWWTAEHIVAIYVSVTGSDSDSVSKKISIYIDGIFVLDFEYKTAAAKEGQKFYTGLRAWSTKVTFSGVSVITNTSPQYKSAEITGSPEVGKILAASGIGYSDANGDPEGKPIFQWMISDSAEGTYKNIPGETASNYKPVAEDIGKFLKVAVIPTALSGISPGKAVISSETAEVKIANEPPTFTSATITGTAKVGVTLTAAGAGYADINGDLAATPLYQWMISDSAGGTYTSISGATNSTYKPVFADLGKFIKVKVTPAALTGASPGATLTSAATSAVLAAPETAPSYTGAIITGTAKVGETLTASGIGYADINGDLEATPAFQWLISDSAGGTYTSISGATSSTYKPVFADLGKFIKVKVTPKALTGASQGTPVISEATSAVLAAPETAPTFTSATITGTAKVGTALTASGAGYSDLNGDLAATPAYQWIISDSAGGTYTSISGATNSTYKPVFADLGKFIKVKVTPAALTGASPGETLTSAATAAVLAATTAAAPSYTGAIITGTAKVGETLTASGIGYADINGDLEATPAFQWLISDSAGGTYTSISGATNSTYTPVTSDLGKFIKVKVTPKALTGTSQGTPVISEATAAITEYTTTLSLGITFSEISSAMIKLINDYYTKYGKYPRSFSPYNYTDIGLIESEWNIAHNNIIYSPTGNRLNVKPAEGFGFEAVNLVTGKTIRMPYTLKYNFVYYVGEGNWYYHKQDPNNIIDISTFKVYSVETGEIIIEQAAPSYTGAIITGTAKVGVTLTASGIGYADINGDLEATPAYQWLISDTSGGTYTSISGATNSTYKPVFADLGKFIKVKVTPKALTGTSQGTPVVSEATAAVLAAEAAPSYTGAAITGTAKVGTALTASGIGYADINGDPEATPAYQWMISDSAGGTYTSISGATNSTYTPVTSDLGKFIKVKVTPKALTGTTPGLPVLSDLTDAVKPATVKPVIIINSAAQQGATNEVLINYDLFGANEELKISLEVFSDSENAVVISRQFLTGDVGQLIFPGKGKIISWDTAEYFGEIDSANVQIRLIAEGEGQNLSDYSYASLALDTKAPDGLDDFSGISSDASSILWSWTPASSETNFKYYRILYSSNIADVQNETADARVWDITDDATLADMETAFTVISGLEKNVTYYAKIYAYDNYGNKSASLIAQYDTADNGNATPPDPIINNPQNPQGGSGIYISGIAQSDSSIDLYIDGENMFPGFAQTDSEGRFSGTVLLKEGEHKIYAVCIDKNKKSGKPSNITNIRIGSGTENAASSGSSLKGNEEIAIASMVSKDVFNASESPILQRPQIIEIKGIDRENVIKITGKGIPNSEVVVFIHPEQVQEQVLVYRVNVNEDGDWVLNHSQKFVELDEGDHEVYALTLDAKSRFKSGVSDIRKFNVKMNRFAVVLSYFDLPTTLLTIFVLLACIAVFFIWRLRNNEIKRRRTLI